MIGDGVIVLVKNNTENNKLDYNFRPETYKVIDRTGNEAVVVASDGKQIKRNVAHL